MNESRIPPRIATIRNFVVGRGKPVVRRPNTITNSKANPERMNPNRAREVSSSPRLARTCPPPHKRALQTAKRIAIPMMRLPYSVRIDLPVNRIVRKDNR